MRGVITCLGVFALAWALMPGPGGSSAADAAELFIIEESRCPACIKFNATVGQDYSGTPQGRLAPLRRVKLGEGHIPAVLDGTIIRGTPTFILMDDGGRMIGRFDGFGSRNNFMSRLDALLTRLR